MIPALAATAALAGMEVWTSLQQGDIIRQQSQLTQAISNMNAKYADIDAWEAEKYGYTEAARYQAVIDQTVGEQKAGYAAENVDVNFGTAKEVQQDSKTTGYLNQLDMLQRAKAKALGLKIEASNYRLGAAMKGLEGDMQASATQNAGVLRGLSTAVSGYTQYMYPKKSGG